MSTSGYLLCLELLALLNIGTAVNGVRLEISFCARVYWK